MEEWIKHIFENLISIKFKFIHLNPHVFALPFITLVYLPAPENWDPISAILPANSSGLVGGENWGVGLPYVPVTIKDITKTKVKNNISLKSIFYDQILKTVSRIVF